MDKINSPNDIPDYENMPKEERAILFIHYAYYLKKEFELAANEKGKENPFNLTDLSEITSLNPAADVAVSYERGGIEWSFIEGGPNPEVEKYLIEEAWRDFEMIDTELANSDYVDTKLVLRAYNEEIMQAVLKTLRAIMPKLKGEEFSIDDDDFHLEDFGKRFPRGGLATVKVLNVRFK